jgi:hypothetical protein
MGLKDFGMEGAVWWEIHRHDFNGMAVQFFGCPDRVHLHQGLQRLQLVLNMKPHMSSLYVATHLLRMIIAWSPSEIHLSKNISSPTIVFALTRRRVAIRYS